MTGVDPDTADPGTSLSGRLCRVTDDLLVCRIEHLPTFAIPLGAPGLAGLVAWAIAISPHQGTEAISYLLVLRAGPDGGPRAGGRFVLATHFRDLTVEILSEDGLILSPHEHAVLARTALTVRLGPGKGAAESFQGLLAFVAPGLDALAGEVDEAELLDLRVEERALVLAGDYVPQWIVLRAADGYRRFAVEEAALHFDGARSVTLTLEPDWSPDLLLERAILVGRQDHRVAILRGRRAA